MRSLCHANAIAQTFGSREIKCDAESLGRARALRVDALLALAALLLGYGAAGMVGGAIPANRRLAPAGRRASRIYVETNGVHTGLIVPVAAAGIDWRDLVRPGDIADPRYAAYDHLAFGWGERDFYLKTPDLVRCAARHRARAPRSAATGR